MSGTIVTFYSYKGGVGRSAALANVGVVLARWGYRVLLVDWDLEAPGLHAYLTRYARQTPIAGITEYLRSDENVDRSGLPVALAIEGADHLAYIAAAAATAPDGARGVIPLDLNALYQSRSLGSRLEELRSEWKEAYDFVLLDSRTGISDIGGICTAQLPDLLCVCFTTSSQSLDGALGVVARASRARDEMSVDRARLLVLPLLTRFESSAERDLTDQWERLVAERISPLVQNWTPKSVTSVSLLPHLRIPYVPRWSFGEELATLSDDPADPLTVTYGSETIAALIAQGLSDSALLIENRDLYVARADRSGADSKREADPFDYDLLVIGDSPGDEYVQRLTTALRAQGVTAGSASVTAAGEELARGRHLVVVARDPEAASLDSLGRRVLLELASADLARVVVPVVLGGDEAELPASLRSFQAILASETIAVPNVAIAIADRVGLSRPSIGQEHVPRANVAGWIESSEQRFRRLLQHQPGLAPLYRHGYWTVAYGLSPTGSVGFDRLRDAIIKSRSGQSGWPEWLWPTNELDRPTIVADAIECWLARESGPDADDPSSADYWRASPEGKLFMLRGYQEDGRHRPQESEPGALFDIVLPTWRVGEAILHSSRMAAHLKNRNALVTFRASWTGLRGRRLAAWANPRRLLFESYVAEEDRYSTEIYFATRDVEGLLPELVFDVLKPLYLLFGFFELPFSLVSEELESMRRGER